MHNGFVVVYLGNYIMIVRRLLFGASEYESQEKF
jgi:hypothetical protein